MTDYYQEASNIHTSIIGLDAYNINLAFSTMETINQRLIPFRDISEIHNEIETNREIFSTLNDNIDKYNLTVSTLQNLSGFQENTELYY